MDLDMDTYTMRCATCGTPLTTAEAAWWLFVRWPEICAEVDHVEDSFRAQGTSVRLYKDLDELVQARWFPPCDQCRTVAPADTP